MNYGGLFDLDNKIKKRDELDKEINLQEFWNRSDREIVLKEYKELTNIIAKLFSIKEKIEFDIDIINSCDEEMISMIDDTMELENMLDNIKINTYFDGPYDKNDCIIEIHPGAGGTESCDWALMLYRMYTRYFSKSDFKYTELDKLDGEEAGIKSVTFEVNGENAYGYFKGENGVHRLVRISPFDANKRRHTSFASVEVIPKFDNNIEIDINENDIRVDIYRSSGPGGQGVNTTDSAVRVTHIPTGIVVTCQNERSQIRNKETALEVLKNKLYNLELQKKNQELNDIKGNQMTNGFGSGKRSYVLCPYTLVKDNESGYESSNVSSILDGEIQEMLEKSIRG